MHSQNFQREKLDLHSPIAMAAKHAFLSAVALAILCTSFARETLHENQEKTPSRLVVKGRVFCDTCVLHQFSNTSHFISGALVAVDCKMNRKTPTVSVRGKTDENGEFKVELNSISHFQRACWARLLSSPEESCDVPFKAKTSHIPFTSNLNGILTYESAPLTYRPRNFPTSLCLNTDKDKQERSSKQIILPPLLPKTPLLPNVPPFLPNLPNMVPPLTSLVPPLSSLVPKTPLLPNVPPFLPNLPSMVPPLTSMVPPLTSLVPPLTSMVPPLSSMVPPLSSMVPPLSSLVPPLSSLFPTLPCVPTIGGIVRPSPSKELGLHPISIPPLRFPAPPLPISIPSLPFPAPPKH